MVALEEEAALLKPPPADPPRPKPKLVANDILIVGAITVFLCILVFAILGGDLRRVAHDFGQSRNPGNLNEYVLAALNRNAAKYKSVIVTPSEKIARTMGISEDIVYQGQRVIRSDNPGFAHCSGITLQAYMDACTLYAESFDKDPHFSLGEMSPSQIEPFRKDFYGFDGNQRTLVDALLKRELGREMRNIDDAIPGDFVQFWRNSGTGHCGVLLDFQRNAEGKIQGIHYWSVQIKNNANPNYEPIGEHVSTFIDEGRIYIVRARVPHLSRW